MDGDPPQAVRRIARAGKICRGTQENDALKPATTPAEAGSGPDLKLGVSFVHTAENQESNPTIMLLRLRNAFRSMSSMIHEQERIANNLANANTIGYRTDRSFTQTLDEYLDIEGAPQSDRDMQQWASMEQGAFESTGNQLDVAIEGEGFFVLTEEDTGNARYTRAGRFTTDAAGQLRDPLGYLVEGENGPIQIPLNAKQIEILQDGTIRADGRPVGALRLVRFESTMNLIRLDNAAFAAPGMEALDLDEPSVRQGFLENSNVNPLSAMTEMIEHFRLFESQQKMLQTSDQILGSVTRDLGKF